jgi:CubicO group peptidase (beta-lactamase class C family)
MSFRILIPIAAMIVIAIPESKFSEAQDKLKEKPADLTDMLEPIRNEYDLPAIVGAVVKGDKIIAEGAVGVRVLGKKERVTLDDRFMIGSCTKRMTSVMVCRVMDTGKLAFDTKLAEVLPNPLPWSNSWHREPAWERTRNLIRG